MQRERKTQLLIKWAVRHGTAAYCESLLPRLAYPSMVKPTTTKNHEIYGGENTEHAHDFHGGSRIGESVMCALCYRRVLAHTVYSKSVSPISGTEDACAYPCPKVHTHRQRKQFSRHTRWRTNCLYLKIPLPGPFICCENIAFIRIPKERLATMHTFITFNWSKVQFRDKRNTMF